MARQQGLCVDPGGLATPAQDGPALEVPNVVGLQFDEAKRRLARFTVDSASKPGVQPAGEVVSQQPTAGTTSRVGSRVALVLSDASLVRVPSLFGQTRNSVTGRLEALRLLADIREAPSDAAPAGHVFEQRPETGAALARGSVVTVTIAQATGTATATLEVPDVVGLPFDAASQQLARFAVNTTVKASLRPKGEVLTQSPAAGTPVRPGSGVSLTLSDGSLVPAPDVVQRRIAASLALPNVVGQRVSDARNLLKAFDVLPRRTESDRPADEVVGQTPAAGTRVSRSARVTLQVSDGSLVYVPELRGLSVAQARAALRQAGDLVESAPGGSDTAIVEQSAPPFGTRLKRGSVVALTLQPRLPPWGWAAAAVSALAAAGIAAARALRRPGARAALQPEFHAEIQINTEPIQALASGVATGSIWVRAELRHERTDVRSTGTGMSQCEKEEP